LQPSVPNQQLTKRLDVLWASGSWRKQGLQRCPLHDISYHVRGSNPSPAHLKTQRRRSRCSALTQPRWGKADRAAEPALAGVSASSYRAALHLPMRHATATSAPGLDASANRWDRSTMSAVEVDSKRRIVLPGGRPGEVYDVQRLDDGQLLVVRLEKPEPALRRNRETCLTAMETNPLQPTMSWEALKHLSREP